MFEIISFTIITWLVFYLLVFRPKHKRLNDRKAVYEKVVKGDWVLLQSGLYAYVKDLSQDLVKVSIDENDMKTMTFNKTSVVKRLNAKPEIGDTK